MLLMIIYGNCQASCLLDALGQMPAVASAYMLRHHDVAFQHEAWDQWKVELYQASVVLVQEIKQREAYPIYWINERERPSIIPFPFLSMPSLWPFDVSFGGSDPRAAELRDARGDTGLVFLDALQSVLRPIADHRARYRAYCTLDHAELPAAKTYLQRRDVSRILDFELRRLQAQDAELKSSLGRYVIVNFRKRRLFHTPFHPTRELNRARLIIPIACLVSIHIRSDRI